MAIFICINDLDEEGKDIYDPKEIIEKKIQNTDIAGIFFYSNSIKDLIEKNKSELWLNYAKEREIPIYACTNSILKRQLHKKINSYVKITGLGKLIEGVVTNAKTVVIGKL